MITFPITFLSNSTTETTISTDADDWSLESTPGDGGWSFEGDPWSALIEKVGTGTSGWLKFKYVHNSPGELTFNFSIDGIFIDGPVRINFRDGESGDYLWQSHGGTTEGFYEFTGTLVNNELWVEMSAEVYDPPSSYSAAYITFVSGVIVS